jgi:hypothetical protein
MGWVRRYFDGIGRRREIESAVLSIIASVLFCAMGILELVRVHKRGGPFFFCWGFYWGVFLAAFGLFRMLYGFLLIRAVGRRLKAESVTNP